MVSEFFHDPSPQTPRQSETALHLFKRTLYRHTFIQIRDAAAIGNELIWILKFLCGLPVEHFITEKMPAKRFHQRDRRLCKSEFHND